MATAVFRNRVIHPEDYDDEEQRRLASKIAAVPERTQYHWKRLYRQGEVIYGSGFIGLLPSYSRCGGARKLDPEVRALMEEVLKGTLRHGHAETQTRGVRRISLTVTRTRPPTCVPVQAKRHLATYDQRLSREGKRAAYSAKDVYRTSLRQTRRHGTYAWAMAHIDHTEVDLELFDSLSAQPMGKCWLTLMILSHPRRVVALFPLL